MKQGRYTQRIFATRAANDGVLTTALAGLEVTWMLVPQTILSHSPVLHDIYIFEARSDAKDAFEVYEWMRTRERNAPAIFVCDRVPSPAVVSLTSADPFAYIASADSPVNLRQLVDQLAAMLENRARLARSDEVVAAGEALREALGALSVESAQRRERLGRAAESLVRARALLTFSAGGGTAARFEQMWPDVLEEVVQRAG